MSKRPAAIDTRDFTYLFFAVMEESEHSQHFDENELFPWCMEIFNDDRKRSKAFITRFLALIQMMNHARASTWVVHENDRIRLHPAMFEAAASLRTRSNGSFPERRFFEEVEHQAQSRYADFSFTG